MATSGTQTTSPTGRFQFPGAATTLAIVTMLVWLETLFIPSGRYETDESGSPIPGSFQQVPSPLSFRGSAGQLVLSPINGVYGLRNPARMRRLRRSSPRTRDPARYGSPARAPRVGSAMGGAMPMET
jgi:hypothetical protein